VGTPLRLKGHKGHATPTAPTLMRVVKISNQQPGYPAGSCVSRHRILKSRCQPLPHVQPYPNEGFSIKLRPSAICHLPSTTSLAHVPAVLPHRLVPFFICTKYLCRHHVEFVSF
jgi:hypothetical protein